MDMYTLYIKGGYGKKVGIDIFLCVFADVCVERHVPLSQF